MISFPCWAARYHTTAFCKTTSGTLPDVGLRHVSARGLCCKRPLYSVSYRGCFHTHLFVGGEHTVLCWYAISIAFQPICLTPLTRTSRSTTPGIHCVCSSTAACCLVANQMNAPFILHTKQLPFLCTCTIIPSPQGTSPVIVCDAKWQAAHTPFLLCHSTCHLIDDMETLLCMLLVAFW